MTIPYSKAYAGGFADLPSTASPIDSAFLNAVEAALIALCATTPSGNFVPVWNATNSRFEPALIKSAQIDAAAAIPYSKLTLTGSVVEADLSLADNTTANVSTAKHGFAPKAPNDATKYLDGTGAYSKPTTGSFVELWDSVDAAVSLPAATITSATLSGSYRHLVVVGQAVCDQADATVFYMRLNGDTAANYDVYNSGTAVMGTASSRCGLASQTGTIPGVFEYRLASYVGTQKKGWVGLSGYHNNTPSQVLNYVSGAWNSTAAITTVGLTMSAGNFTTGTRFTVYGMA